MKSPIKVSVVISERDEGHNNAFTVQSIINDLETFLKPDEFEIILVENCTKDESSWRFLVERGMYYHRTLKILFDPIAGNVSARNKGARIAQGKYLFFSDAHMSYKIGSFKAMVDAIDETGGMVHPAVQWLGGYHPSEPSWQYTIKLGEKIWGTWNRLQVDPEKSFYIPICGHCCLGMLREQFLDFGGYNGFFRCYGGGEVYLDMKWWMLGSSVSSVPKALGYHLSAGRGYAFKQDDLIHNMMLLALALRADAMAERVFIRYLDKSGTNRKVLDEMWEDAQREAEPDRQTLPKRIVRGFMDTIVERPWDKLNIEKFGHSSSAIGIYDKSWLNGIEGEAKSFYDNSPLQAELQELIDTKLKHLVYKAER